MLEHVGQPREFDFDPAGPPRARPAPRRHRHRARREGQRRPVLLPDRRGRPAAARDAQPGHEPRRSPPGSSPSYRRCWSSRTRWRAPASSAQAAENVYHLPEEDLYLVGTSEVPLAAFHMDEVLDADSLPLPVRRLVDLLPQGGRLLRQGHPRDPAGAPVRQDRDVLATPTRPTPRPSTCGCSAWEKEMLAKVELPYRVIDVAAGDLGRVGRAQVRLRGVGADPGPLPRADLDVELHDLPGPPAADPAARRRGHPAARHAQRHPGHHPLDRRDPGEPPAGRRLGRGAGGAAARSSAASRCSSRSRRDRASQLRQPPSRAGAEPPPRASTSCAARCTRFLNGHGGRPPAVGAGRGARGRSATSRPTATARAGWSTELEAEVAALLGKPAAVFMPSGTMAQQIALRDPRRPHRPPHRAVAPHLPPRAARGPGGRAAARPAPAGRSATRGSSSRSPTSRRSPSTPPRC